MGRIPDLTEIITNFTEKEGLSNNVVWSIIEDKKGNLWFGTSGGYACKYDGKTFTSYLINKNIENNIVQSIKEDKKGNLWFGTLFGGVTCFDGKIMKNYSVKQGLCNILFGVFQKIKKVVYGLVLQVVVFLNLMEKNSRTIQKSKG